MSDGGANQRGGAGGVVLEKRIEDVEKNLESMKNEFLRLSSESTVADKRLKVLEESVSRHEQSIIQLKETTIEMKVQYANIMGKIDSLDTKIFSLLRDGRKDSAAERKVWTDLLKWVLSGTIIAIVGYIFLGGGQ
jgi:septal ring factor EnvC (AmiA/AmiB activator)